MLAGVVLGGLFLVEIEVHYVQPYLSRSTSQSQLMSMESFVRRPARTTNDTTNTFGGDGTSAEWAFASEPDDVHNKGIIRGDMSAALKREASRANVAAAGNDEAVANILAGADPELRPILRILHQGGYDIANGTEFNEATISMLPKWSTILDAYGPPKIFGLETCEDYRRLVPFKHRNEGVAGTFNSGTNLLATLILYNCQMKRGRFGRVQWQVPWGELYIFLFLCRRSELSVAARYTFDLPACNERDNSPQFLPHPRLLMEQESIILRPGDKITQSNADPLLTRLHTILRCLLWLSAIQ